MIDGQKFFDQPVRYDLITYDNIWKIGKRKGNDHTADCLLSYKYFEKYYKMIAMDLGKQQTLDADPKSIQQINFIGNLENNALLLKKHKKPF